jgi:hydrogenase-4 membrane subunit HyfE
MSLNLLEKYRTEVLATLIALVLILTGLFLPLFLTDQLPMAPSGFEDATWFKQMIQVLFVGMGVLCFIWLIVINRFIRKSRKSDIVY